MVETDTVNERTIPIQFDERPLTSPNSVSVIVYVQKTEHSIKKYGNDILRYIGGQTHAICNQHRHPLIPVPDRIATCSKCERKEHYRCPKLGCKICLCNKCFDELNESNLNIIQAQESHEDYEKDDSDSESEPELVNDNTNILLRDFDSDSDDDSEDESNNHSNNRDYLSRGNNDDEVECDDLEDFVTHGATDFGYDSDDSYKEDNDGGALGDFDISTDAGDIPYQIEEEDNLKQTRGMNISGHVILNFVGSLLTRKKHDLKSSSIHKYFLQRLVTTSIGKSVSLLYPEAMLFPCIFWLMKERYLIGAIPATILNDKSNEHGFASIPQHIRSRLTSTSFQTSTNNRYIAWSYDMMTNLATNNHDTRMVVNKGLTASKDESGGLTLRGGNKESPLLDSIDSKQIIKNLMASQNYYPFDFFYHLLATKNSILEQNQSKNGLMVMIGQMTLKDTIH